MDIRCKLMMKAFLIIIRISYRFGKVGGCYTPPLLFEVSLRMASKRVMLLRDRAIILKV